MEDALPKQRERISRPRRAENRNDDVIVIVIVQSDRKNLFIRKGKISFSYFADETSWWFIRDTR